MEERAIELLEKLANKLGVTIEQIWTILINQTKVELGSEILDLIFFIILVSISSWLLITFVIKKSYEKDRWGNPVDKEFFIRGFIIVLFCIITLCFIIQTIDIIYTVPILIFNPEYWALQEILKLM